ncbi:hypothetical protein KY285_017450 [Solanum tuberosum]|uniref:Uncharacterized protein n=1 Tax=Solanum tuberosum TaxID=4113 RepID=M1B881_SOLTU|nr:hypothetical protein KY285_017450 [Solanum tuberosum]
MVNTATNDVATVASIPFKPPPLEYSEPKLDLLTCGGYSSNYRNSSSMTGVEVAGARLVVLDLCVVLRLP